MRVVDPGQWPERLDAFLCRLLHFYGSVIPVDMKFHARLVPDYVKLPTELAY